MGGGKKKAVEFGVVGVERRGHNDLTAVRENETGQRGIGQGKSGIRGEGNFCIGVVNLEIGKGHGDILVNLLRGFEARIREWGDGGGNVDEGGMRNRSGSRWEGSRGRGIRGRMQGVDMRRMCMHAGIRPSVGRSKVSDVRSRVGEAKEGGNGVRESLAGRLGRGNVGKGERLCSRGDSGNHSALRRCMCMYVDGGVGWGSREGKGIRWVLGAWVYEPGLLSNASLCSRLGGSLWPHRHGKTVDGEGVAG